MVDDEFIARRPDPGVGGAGSATEAFLNSYRVDIKTQQIVPALSMVLGDDGEFTGAQPARDTDAAVGDRQIKTVMARDCGDGSSDAHRLTLDPTFKERSEITC
jgi:hypothetical protein